MKRLLILSALIIASVQLNASHLASELNLRLQHKAWFTIKIDNHNFDEPINFFQTGNLEPGEHYLQVTRLGHGYYGPFTAPVNLFNGYIHIPAHSKVHAFIDDFGKLRINQITALSPVYVPQQNECAPVPVCHNTGMNNYDFNSLKHTIDNLSFESSKMKVAKQAAAFNTLTSQQVAELVGMMTFESSKLELAKIAFKNTVDKQNYFIINNAFSFESSISELNDFIFRS